MDFGALGAYALAAMSLYVLWLVGTVVLMELWDRTLGLLFRE